MTNTYKCTNIWSNGRRMLNRNGIIYVFHGFSFFGWSRPLALSMMYPDNVNYHQFYGISKMFKEKAGWNACKGPATHTGDFNLNNKKTRHVEPLCTSVCGVLVCMLRLLCGAVVEASTRKTFAHTHSHTQICPRLIDILLLLLLRLLLRFPSPDRWYSMISAPNLKLKSFERKKRAKKRRQN